MSSSANMFVFGDFNTRYEDWLTYSCGSDRPDELCYNFSISNYLTQMVNFSIWIHDCDSHSPALLDLFISSDAGVCSTMAFSPLGNTDHVGVSVFIVFLSNSKWDAPFHRIAYDYSHAECDSLCNHLRDNPWDYIFKSVLLPLLVYFVSGLRLELMYISLAVYIRSSLTHCHGFQLLALLP